MKYVFSFEGLNGCGKSTIINELAIKLEYDFCVEKIRFPGGGISEVRDLVKNPNYKFADHSYMFLNMADQINFKNIYDSINSNQHVIFLVDRMIDSTMVYQSCINNINIDLIKSLTYLVEVIPNKTFFIDIDYDTSIKRRKNIEPNKKDWNGSTKDKWESQFDKDSELFAKMRYCYLDLAKEYNNRIVVFNGNDSVEKLSNEIYRNIIKLARGL